MILQIKFKDEKAKKIYDNGKLLSYATNGSSGFDLRAVEISKIIENFASQKENNVYNQGEVAFSDFNLSNDAFYLKKNERCLVKTGIHAAIAEGFELQVRPRSGLALKNGITVVNTPGTVDSDYRGEICVILLNTSNLDFKIEAGDRIAQCVAMEICKVDFVFCENLDETLRSSSGFGSSGVR